MTPARPPTTGDAASTLARNEGYTMQEGQESPLVWIDMEMSGLNPASDEVLEIAVLLTNQELDVIAQGPHLVIQHPPHLFSQMDSWNQDHHSKSGLWQEVITSTVTTVEAEQSVLDFLQKHVGPKLAPLCGNSINQDRMFLMRHMPRVNEHLHYRMIDVSCLKELVRRWYPHGPKAPAKNGQHRALEDILESIAELKFYRQHFFQPLRQ